MHTAALITGDGIGPEICEATQRVLDATGIVIDWRAAPMGLEAKRRLGGPLAWRNRKDFTFFQAPTESNFIRLGVKAALKAAPSGQAPTEGAER